MVVTAIYASSKAALTNLSETLRHELSPFGVSVICLQVGGVDTNFDARTTEFNLPPNSYYATIKDDIAGWATGSIKPRGQSGESFAEAVVSDILGARKNGVVFRGKYASSVRVLVDWFPGWVVVSYITRWFLIYFNVLTLVDRTWLLGCRIRV